MTRSNKMQLWQNQYYSDLHVKNGADLYTIHGNKFDQLHNHKFRLREDLQFASFDTTWLKLLKHLKGRLNYLQVGNQLNTDMQL